MKSTAMNLETWQQKLKELPRRSLLNGPLLFSTCIKVVKNPRELDPIIRLVERTWEPEHVQKMIDYLGDDQVVKAALKEQYRVGKIDVKELSTYPEGTFGYEFAKFVTAAGIDPNDLPNIKAVDEHSYFLAHLYETHDIWHVVTGFDTTTAGELGLQAFYLAQFPSKVAQLIIGLGALNSFLLEFDDYERRFEMMVKGWQMGKKARPLFGQDWKQLWGTKLSKIQKELGIDTKLGYAEKHGTITASRQKLLSPLQ